MSDLQLDEDREFGEYDECEFCGQEQIRYVHTLTHRDYAEDMRVGCICAERLTEDYINPKRREIKLRNRAARRSNWPRRAWKESAKGNRYLTTSDDHHVVVFTVGQGRKLVIDGQLGRRVYQSELAAQLAAFDFLYLNLRKP